MFHTNRQIFCSPPNSAESLHRITKNVLLPSSLQLTYFDSKGRCEYLRLLLAASGLEFEDNRLAFGSQEWADMKPSWFDIAFNSSLSLGWH